MKKQQNWKEQRQDLVLRRETLRNLEDENLKSIAGGCVRMPFTCTCPIAV